MVRHMIIVVFICLFCFFCSRSIAVHSYIVKDQLNFSWNFNCIALWQSCGNSCFKAVTKKSSLENHFSANFHPTYKISRMKLSELLKNLRTIKKNKKGEEGVCKSHYWSQQNCLDKRKNICFMHFFANTPL